MQKEFRGSITVFLSLILLTLISLAAVSLESAHQSASRAYISMKTDEAGDQLLSHYEQDLYDKYRILAFNDRFNKEEITGQAFVENRKEDAVFHLGHTVPQLAFLNTVYLGDKNGEAFQKEVNEIAGSDLIGEGKKKIMDYLNAAKEGKDMDNQALDHTGEDKGLTDLVDQYVAVQEECLKVNQAACKIEEDLKKYESLSANIPDDDQSYYHAVEPVRKKLEKEEVDLKQELLRLKDSIHIYEQQALEVSVVLDSAREKLSDKTISEENRTILHEQVESIMDMTDPKGESYKNLLQVKGKALDSLEELEAGIIPGPAKLYAYRRQNKIRDFLFQSGYDLAKKLKDLSLAKGKKETGNKELAHSVKELMNTVGAIMKAGPFAYIVGDESKLSDRKLVMDEMPSVFYKKKSVENTDNLLKRAIISTSEATSVNFYLFHYMACYTDKGTYDLEYILGGKNSDKENLKTVINQLVALRSSMNMAYLMKDLKKKQEAEAAAAALTSLVGMPVLAKAASYAILAAWAYAEAVCDVKNLVQGGRIAFLKNKDQWQLSLEGAASAVNHKNENKTDPKGLTYKEYLRLMLFFHTRIRNMFRGMDMIQWNLCQKNPEFRISQCLYGTDIQVQTQIPSLFYSGAGKVKGFAYEHVKRFDYGGLSGLT